MEMDERIGIILHRELDKNLKPHQVGRLLGIARKREINEKGADVYVSATLIALVGYSYETLRDMASNEARQEDLKAGKIRQSLENPLKKEEEKDA